MHRPGDTDVDRTRSRRIWAAVAAFLGAVLLVVGSFTVPIPMFYGQTPGPLRDVERLVEVEGRRRYSSEGELLMTTVSFDTRVTVADLLSATLDPAEDIVRREQVTQGMSLDELERVQLQEMRDSQAAAIVVAATALGADPPTGEGAFVAEVIASPAQGRLHDGDRIVSFDGSDVATVCDLHRLLHVREPGDEIRLTVARGDGTEEVTLTAGSNPVDPSKAFLGVGLESDFDFEAGFDATFDTGRVAGPSAGLMLSLGLYDQLTPEDLTRGRSIAGTGTITCDGSVGPIGGIRQKIAAAEVAGADAFLTPVANVADARAVADDIEIVAIDSFGDALRYLTSS